MRIYEEYRFHDRESRPSKITISVEGLYKKERSEDICLANDGALLDLLQGLLELRCARQMASKTNIKNHSIAQYRVSKASSRKNHRPLAVQAQINAAVGMHSHILYYLLMIHRRSPVSVEKAGSLKNGNALENSTNLDNFPSQEKPVSSGDLSALRSQRSG